MPVGLLGAIGGLFGGGAGGGLFQTIGALGMGLGTAQAFGGGGGPMPTAKIRLTEEGEKLQEKTFETIKKQREEGLMPPNLASIYIGRIKKQEGERARAGRGLLSAAATRRVGTGGGVGAALTEAGARMEGLAAPEKWRAGQKEEEFLSALTNLQNIRNLELQTAPLKAQSQFIQRGLGRMRGAGQGQALGDIAQWLAMLKYPPYQS